MSVKRLLDCTPSDLAAYSKTDLLAAIAGSEGRVLACETIGLTPPLLVDVTNAEYAASLSADILLLNMFDVQHPVINALPKVPEIADRPRCGHQFGALQPTGRKKQRWYAVEDEQWPSCHGRKRLPRCRHGRRSDCADR